MPTTPAFRRLEFARFFFPEAFEENSPSFHLDLFGFYASGQHFGIAAPRGHAKTTVSSVEVIYRIVNNLTHYTLVVSDTYSQARDIVDNIKSELEDNEMLRWVYGDLTSDWHWTSGSFTTKVVGDWGGCRVTARGSNMKVRGLKYRHWRPDFAIGDDLENDEMVDNPERRAKLLNWIKKALMPALNRKHRQVAIVGTVLHSDSLLQNILDKKPGFGGWLNRHYMALSVDENGIEQSLWPSMFPVAKLKAMRDDPNDPDYMGPNVFSQEMQNKPVDDAARVFKREWVYGTSERPNTYSLTAKETQWRLEHAEPKYKDSSWLKENIKTVYMAVDPAISEKETADYFAIVVIGVDANGEIWILDVWRQRTSDIDVQVAKIIEIAQKWSPDKIKVEAVAYQAGLARAVSKAAAAAHAHLPVFPVTPDKDKFRRAIIHSANFAGNLVHIRTDHEFYDAFANEFLSFPKGEHDDMMDAYMHAAEDLVQRFKARVFTKKPGAFRTNR